MRIQVAAELWEFWLPEKQHLLTSESQSEFPKWRDEISESHGAFWSIYKDYIHRLLTKTTPARARFFDPILRFLEVVFAKENRDLFPIDPVLRNAYSHCLANKHADRNQKNFPPFYFISYKINKVILVGNGKSLGNPKLNCCTDNVESIWPSSSSCRHS